MPTPQQITTFPEPDDPDPWVRGAAPAEVIEIVAPDPDWPARYAQLAADLRGALGDLLLRIEHVGSTSVPGLAAKDVIDIDLEVADPAAEAAYAPSLEALGYWHALREPSWYGHRGFVLDAPRAHLHVWRPDCPELARHLLFRDWLRGHPEDRRRYEAAKRAAVGPGDLDDYAASSTRPERSRLHRCRAALRGPTPMRSAITGELGRAHRHRARGCRHPRRRQSAGGDRESAASTARGRHCGLAGAADQNQQVDLDAGPRRHDLAGALTPEARAFFASPPRTQGVGALGRGGQATGDPRERVTRRRARRGTPGAPRGRARAAARAITRSPTGSTAAAPRPGHDLQAAGSFAGEAVAHERAGDAVGDLDAGLDRRDRDVPAAVARGRRRELLERPRRAAAEVVDPVVGVRRPLDEQTATPGPAVRRPRRLARARTRDRAPARRTRRTCQAARGHGRCRTVGTTTTGGHPCSPAHRSVETLAGYESQLTASAFAHRRAAGPRRAGSVGGLVKYDGRFDRFRPLDEAGFSFQLGEDETLVATFDISVARYLADVRASDPGGRAEPPAPSPVRADPVGAATTSCTTSRSSPARPARAARRPAAASLDLAARTTSSSPGAPGAGARRRPAAPPSYACRTRCGSRSTVQASVDVGGERRAELERVLDRGGRVVGAEVEVDAVLHRLGLRHPDEVHVQHLAVDARVTVVVDRPARSEQPGVELRHPPRLPAVDRDRGEAVHRGTSHRGVVQLECHDRTLSPGGQCQPLGVAGQLRVEQREERGRGRDHERPAGDGAVQALDPAAGLAGDQARRRRGPRGAAPARSTRRRGPLQPSTGRGRRTRAAGCRAPAAAGRR